MIRVLIVLLVLSLLVLSAGVLAVEEVDPADAAGRGNNKFAVRFYQQARSEPGNLFFSPYSIRTALAMTHAGAEGNTERQMSQVLSMDPHQSLAALQEELEAAMTGSGPDNRFRFKVANSLWGQQDLQFKDDFLTLLEKAYGAELHEVDFKADTEAARAAINEWVEEATNRKIKDLVPPGALTPLTRLVLANAVYFKGAWRHDFSEGATKEEDFHVEPGKTARVQMMHQTEKFRYAETDLCQMVELPYRGSFNMLVVLPKERDGLAEVEKNLTRILLAENGNYAPKMARKRVELSLPKFKFTNRMALADMLKEMGMKDAFTGDADFSGMTQEEDLYIQAVLHKAYVDVDEEGTEAAAATGVMAGVTSAPLQPEEPVVFRADHPFLFVIQSQGAIVFMGRVVRPAQ